MNLQQFVMKPDMRIDELKGLRLAPGAKKIYMPGEIEAQNSVEAQETIWTMPEILADIETLRPSV